MLCCNVPFGCHRHKGLKGPSNVLSETLYLRNETRVTSIMKKAVTEAERSDRSNGIAIYPLRWSVESIGENPKRPGSQSETRVSVGFDTNWIGIGQSEKSER